MGPLAHGSSRPWVLSARPPPPVPSPRSRLTRDHARLPAVACGVRSLLVDEAYYLYNAANDRDYGQESIEILLNVMENNKEDIIVVLAGYKDRMDKFYGYIPGMNSRIGNHIEFPNYEVDELVDIGMVMCRELEYTMDQGAVEAFRAYMAKRMTMPFFSNARTVRNAIDLARMRAAVRIFNEKTDPMSDGMVNESELMTITGADFPTVAELEAAGDAAVIA